MIEALHYCTVGSFLKNPLLPIWVIGSESHFTVLFSLDMHLVAKEGAVTQAKRLFAECDMTGGGKFEDFSALCLKQRDRDRF